MHISNSFEKYLFIYLFCFSHSSHHSKFHQQINNIQMCSWVFVLPCASLCCAHLLAGWMAFQRCSGITSHVLCGNRCLFFCFTQSLHVDTRLSIDDTPNCQKFIILEAHWNWFQFYVVECLSSALSNNGPLMCTVCSLPTCKYSHLGDWTYMEVTDCSVGRKCRQLA